MNDPLSDIEALVRTQLEQRAETIDPRAHFARVQTRLGVRPITRRRPWVWGLVAAASVMIAFLFWQGRSPARASAENLVREARAAHHLPLDRCYLVELRKESELLEEGYPAVPARITRLWTRGDRFWVESVNPRERWAWGRDDRGRVWMAFGARRALRLEPEEVPRWFGLYCDQLTLKPETLLEEVLTNFSLRRETTNDDQGQATQIIHATRRFHHPYASLRSAVLEIDSETRALRRLTLERMRMGRLVATVTYTLVETQMQEDGKYELEGHLTAPYEVYTKEYRPDLRLRYLKLRFGPQAGMTFGLESAN